MNPTHEEKALLSRITLDPEICHGKPCIRGLRYPVVILVDLIRAGMTHAEILEDYPDLEEEDLLASLAYVEILSRSRRVEPAKP